MKKFFLLSAVLILAGAGCPLSTPPPSDVSPAAAPEVRPEDTLRLYDENGGLLLDMTVRKIHRIGSSPCPDMFGPVTVEFPEGWGDVPLPPSTDVPWLDLPDSVTSGEPFEMGFNCNINRFDSHAEAATVNFDFSAYAKEHPGIEHTAGVPSGGTFIVVTETWDKPPVADFALPYVCCSDCESIEYCALGE